MRRLVAALALALSFAPASFAAADEMATDAGSEWACSDPIDFPSGKGKEIAAEAVLSSGSQGSPSYLFFRVPDHEDIVSGGTMLAIRDGAGWRTYGVENGGAYEAAKRSKDGKRIVAVSMFSREGPGPGYTIVSSVDGLSTFHCGSLDFPDTLNKPDWRNEFLTFDDLNGDASGSLVLIGEAERQQEDNQATEYYRYRSADNGASWSKPEKIDKPSSPLAGDFETMSADEIGTLWNDYRKSLEK